MFEISLRRPRGHISEEVAGAGFPTTVRSPAPDTGARPTRNNLQAESERIGLPMNWFESERVSLTLPLVPKPIVRQFSRPYIAGATLDEALGSRPRRCARQGAMTTIDILGEFISRRRRGRGEHRGSLHPTCCTAFTRRSASTETNISVKLSALGLLLDEGFCAGELMRSSAPTRYARAPANFIRIDMEDSSLYHVAPSTIYQALYDPSTASTVSGSCCSPGCGARSTISWTTSRASRPISGLCKGIYLEPREDRVHRRPS